ncbi:MAG: hypothetical protein AAF927_08460 [Bacteroidota bacterium]
MKNQIIKLEEKNRKVFGFSDENIIISSKGHSTFDSLLASAEKSGMLESVKVIPLHKVTLVKYNEKQASIQIRYEKDGKEKSESVTLDDASLQEAIVSEIGQVNNLNRSVAEESKMQPLLLNILALVLIPVFTWVARGMAIDAQNGIEYQATGRRSGLKQLLASAVEFIGPTGVLILGLLGFAYMGYRTYQRYTKPAAEVTFS